jgi:proline dehydrogenase
LNSHPERELSFNDTEIAFRDQSNSDLWLSWLLFQIMGNPSLTQLAEKITSFAFKAHLPVKLLVKPTVFRQFCGGENLKECERTVRRLAKSGVSTILDYAIEGAKSEKGFNDTADKVCETILCATGSKNMSFCVFKPSGIARIELLSKVSSGEHLEADEVAEWDSVVRRVHKICHLAASRKVRIFVDAEESWTQGAIDALTLKLMQKFNRAEPIVYTTLQMYRSDRLAYLKELDQQARREGFKLGFKIVRGAYMEKERARAEQLGYDSPIYASREATDKAYDEAISFCVDRLDNISFCAGTHNDHSTLKLTQLMVHRGIANNDSRIEFAQLLGMGDHLSFNLAYHGYNVSKYVPFGPVDKVLPYLSRRAAENTSIKGQTGRELSLITAEMRRRRQELQISK